jgi:hypothetical protein
VEEVKEVAAVAAVAADVEYRITVVLVTVTQALVS